MDDRIRALASRRAKRPTRSPRRLVAWLLPFAAVSCASPREAEPARAEPARSPAPTAAAPAFPSASAPAAPSPLGFLPQSALPAVLCDDTGSQAPLGAQARLGAMLALRQALGAAPDPAIAFDTASNPAFAADRGIAAAAGRSCGIGFTDSDVALAGVPPFIAAGKPFVVIGATDPRLPERCGEGTFLACFGDDAQAIAGAEFGASHFGRRAVVVFDSRRDYCRTLAAHFRTHLGSSLGGAAVAEFDVAAVNIMSVPPHLVEIAADIDFVYLALEPEDVLAAVHAVRSALPQTPIVGGDSMDFDGVERMQGLPADGIWFTTHAWLGQGASPEAAAFAASFEREHGLPATAFAALGYDAACIAVDARRRAGSDDPSAIAAALAATREFRGVTGPIDYSAGPVPRKDVWVVVIVGGKRALADRIRPPAP